MRTGIAGRITRRFLCRILMLPSVLSVLLSTASAQVSSTTDTGTSDIRTPQMILDFLTSEAEPSPDRLKAGGMKTIAAIEDLLDQRNRAATNNALGLIGKLKDPDAQIREKAIRESVLVSGTLLPLIEAEAQKLRDREIRDRMLDVADRVAEIEDRVKDLVKLLGTLYAEHMDRIFGERWPKLLTNLRDLRLIRTFDIAPFDKMWQTLQTKDKDQQLTFLLLKMYTGERKNAFEQLQKFPATDVLRVAAATWWPVEIAPIQMDGAYGWTTRAEKLDGNVAFNVMRLSVVMPDYGNVADRGKWLHFERAYRWTYIFRYPVEPDTAPFVIQEGKSTHYYDGRKSQNDVLVYGDCLRQDDLWKWAANGPEILSLGEGFLTTSRGIPATAELPMARITYKESLYWCQDRAFEWARPLFPPRIAGQLKFVPNKYPVPVVECPDVGRTGQETKSSVRPPQ